MIRATRVHQGKVVHILSQAFQDNPSVNFVLKPGGDHKAKLKRIAALIQYAFSNCRAFGEVWMSEDEQAVALLLFNDKRKFSLRGMRWDVKLALQVIGLKRVLKIHTRETLIKEHHPRSRYAYLWFIGVAPEAQGKRIGTRLLREVTDHCHAQSRPVYLETSLRRNVRWYEAHGYVNYRITYLSYALYLMKNEAPEVRP